MSDSIKNIPWDDWKVVQLIGRGSFGAVYEIQRQVFDETETSALKVLSIPQNKNDIEEMYSDGYDNETITSTIESHLQSIVTEYSMMKKMNGCINIVNCEDIKYVSKKDDIGYDVYIKMELLTPLTKALPEKITEDIVIKIAKDICNALKVCKEHAIIHRDIKPQNIFVSKYGDYKLGDFGIAKTIEKTVSGTKIGTYKYMAPEVYNNQPYGSSADIYSLGLMLYWLLNERRLPFMPLPPEKPNAGMEEECRQRRFAGEKIPAPINGSAELKRIVLKACSFKTSDRYQDAVEMLDDLMQLDGSNKGVEKITSTSAISKLLSKNKANVNESKKTSEDNNQPPKTKKRELILPQHHGNLDEIIEEREEALNNKNKNKKFVIAIILAIIAAIIVASVLFVVIKGRMPDVINLAEQGVFLESTAGLVLNEPDNRLIPSKVYNSIKYTPQMFYGSYTLCPDSTGEELFFFKNNTKYNKDVYNEDGVSLTNLPYKLVAGSQSLSGEKIIQLEGENWVKLYYYSDIGSPYTVYAAYEISGNRIIVKPIASFGEDETSFDYELAEKNTEYVFEFSGPYLTLSKGEDSVKLVADGFEKTVVGETDDFYNISVNNTLSQSSPRIDNIQQIYLYFNEDNNKISLINSDHIYIGDVVGKLDYDGVFTFSYSETGSSNAKSLTRQYVYFYCGEDGLVLTDGQNTYYYQGE